MISNLEHMGLTKLLHVPYKVDMNNNPSIETLRRLLDYDPDSGVLTWRERPDNPEFNTRWAGKRALDANCNGYRSGAIMGTNHLAHRVCFAHYHGYWPTEIDHINRDKADNRISNLRDVTHAENLSNHPANTKEFKGVYLDKRNGRYSAQVYVSGKTKTIGVFSTREAARDARRAWLKDHSA